MPYEPAGSARVWRGWGVLRRAIRPPGAARRLAERGLLREEDPIKLQRAVTEIAYRDGLWAPIK